MFDTTQLAFLTLTLLFAVLFRSRLRWLDDAGRLRVWRMSAMGAGFFLLLLGASGESWTMLTATLMLGLIVLERRAVRA